MSPRGAGLCVVMLGLAACSIVVDTSDLARDEARGTPAEAGAAVLADGGDEAAAVVTDAATDADAGAVLAPVIADAFEREVTTGLGNADVGGPWDAPRWSVTGGRARTIAQIGTSSHAYLPRVALGDADVTVDFAAPELSDGSGAYFYASVRGYRKANYNMGVRVRPEGTIDLNLKTTVDGEETTVANVSGFAPAAADATIRIRGIALGTRIRVKAWNVSAPEPENWQIDESADDPRVERGLDPYVTVYLSSGATATHPYFADNYVLRPAR